MKIRINENQFDRVLQKYLDKLLDRYSGKICRFVVDGYDAFWIMAIISQDWRDENNTDDFWIDVVRLKKEIKEELKTIFSGINFYVGSYLGNC